MSEFRERRNSIELQAAVTAGVIAGLKQLTPKH